MAEQKEMNSIEYYVRTEKRLLPNTTNTSRGFYEESELKTKAKTVGNYTGPNNSLNDEKDATSEHGWIAPYDYYKNNTKTVNTSRDTTNGMIQKSQELDTDKYFYKNLYWWCEDLHNWCVYKADCVNNPYLNSFYLHVWNGLDNWVPATYNFLAKPDERFAALQNRIITNKLLRNECIVMHRGSLRNTPNAWTFGNGPLTINHALVLKKADKFTINSDNNFQTIRWSTPKHIESMSEFEDANRMMKMEAGGEEFAVDIKIRHDFAATNSMTVFAGGYENNGIPNDNPWFQGHKFNACDKGTSYSCTFNNYTSDDSNGHLIRKKESQCNSYNDHTRMIYWKNNIVVDNNHPYLVNKAIADDPDYDTGGKYGKPDLKIPLNYRSEVYNHVLMNAFAMEKIFAVHFYKKDAVNNKLTLLNNKWINLDAPEEDIATDPYDAESKSYPIYMSYVDIQMLFYKSMRSYWVMPGNKSIDRTCPFTYDVWKKKNYVTVLTIMSLIHPNPASPEYYFQQDYATQENFVSNIMDGVCTVTAPRVLYTIKKTNTELVIGDLLIPAALAAGMDPINEPRLVDEVLSVFLPMLMNGIVVQGTVGENITGALLGLGGISLLGPVGAPIAMGAYNSYRKHKNANTIALPQWNINVYKYTKSDSGYTLATADPVMSYGDLADETTANKVATVINICLNNGLFTGDYIEDFDSMWKGYKMYIIQKPLIFDVVTSHYREGLSTGNPAVYRLPSGDIALASQLHWAGKNRLIGGPDENGSSSVQAANRFINEVCQGYFGNGNKKTIDEHWLKEYKLDKDQQSKDGGLVNNAALESGYVFEQINNNSTDRLKLTIVTNRPVVITTGTGENVDVAKKW